MEAEAEEEAAVVVMVGKKKGEEEVSGYLKGREGEGVVGTFGAHGEDERCGDGNGTNQMGRFFF